jgi:hypothetical protein
MSLKAVHLLFIVLATLLAFGFAAWCVREYMTQRKDLYIGLGGSSFLAGIALIVYGVRVRRKFKQMKSQ